MELFQCPHIAGKLTLSEDSCAKYHVASQSQEWRLRLPHCVECAIGAKHAGLEVGVPLHLRCVCLRCGSGEGRRVFGRLCMSCYNREVEARKGKNAKGGLPREYRPLGRFLFIHTASCRKYLVEASCAVEARLVAQKLWGLVDLVLDARRSMWSNQIMIFEEGRTVNAKTPCSGIKVDWVTFGRSSSRSETGKGGGAAV